MRSLRTRPGRGGFTLLEMTGVLVIVLSIGGWGLATLSRPSPAAEAGSAALRVRAMLMGAFAATELDGSDVLIRAEAGSAGAGGRFLALATAAGVVPQDVPGSDWLALEGGVRWRSGTATVDPTGAATDGKVPGTVHCSAQSCETGAADYVVYYLGHARSHRVAWAVVLTRERDVMLFRWNPTTRVWHAGGR